MALKDYKLTTSGDLELNLIGQPTVLLGKEAIDQIVRVALSLWKGNWFRDTARGVDWLGVLKLVYSRAEVIDIVSSALRRVAYIDEVIDVALKVDNAERKAQITYTVRAFGNLVTGSEVL
jgi:hypothetical protein